MRADGGRKDESETFSTCRFPGCDRPTTPSGPGVGRPPAYCDDSGHNRSSAWRARVRQADERPRTAGALRLAPTSTGVPPDDGGGRGVDEHSRPDRATVGRCLLSSLETELSDARSFTDELLAENERLRHRYQVLRDRLSEQRETFSALLDELDAT